MKFYLSLKILDIDPVPNDSSWAFLREWIEADVTFPIFGAFFAKSWQSVARGWWNIWLVSGPQLTICLEFWPLVDEWQKYRVKLAFTKKENDEIHEILDQQNESSIFKVAKGLRDLPWILRKANDKFAGSTITTKTKKPLKTLTSRTRTTWFFWKNFRWWCLQFRISAMKSKQNWVHAKMCFSVDLTEKSAVSRKIAIIADLDKIIVVLHYWQLLTN